MTSSEIALRVGRDQALAVDALAERWGGRVGLAGVLRDLDRVARRSVSPRRRLGRNGRLLLRWDAEDSRTRTWYPQGITTSADSGFVPAGRAVVLVSWYAARHGGAAGAGARLSVLDLSDPNDVRYRHVALVRATGGDRVAPVPVHAGGLAWYRDLLYVAATYRGVRVFDLRDVLRVPPEATASTFDHRFVVPERFSYSADPPGSMRYSFVSVDRTSTPHALVAGEYTRWRRPARLARFDLEPTGRLATGAAGVAVPSYVGEVSIRRMQGAVAVDGRYVVSASRGPHRRGDLWVGVPGSTGAGLSRHRRALPAGPEDLACWTDRDEMWGLTEHPGRRYVLAVGLSAVLSGPRRGPDTTSSAPG
ncbi:MAG: hypothetical protein M3P83_08910 [Actinomycetota bacterium]|nr:hypothetical protein [Actinomycetota bacterium]